MRLSAKFRNNRASLRLFIINNYLLLFETILKVLSKSPFGKFHTYREKINSSNRDERFTVAARSQYVQSSAPIRWRKESRRHLRNRRDKRVTSLFVRSFPAYFYIVQTCELINTNFVSDFFNQKIQLGEKIVLKFNLKITSIDCTENSLKFF